MAQSEAQGSFQWISEHPVTGKNGEINAHIPYKINHRENIIILLWLIAWHPSNELTVQKISLSKHLIPLCHPQIAYPSHYSTPLTFPTSR